MASAMVTANIANAAQCPATLKRASSRPAPFRPVRALHGATNRNTRGSRPALVLKAKVEESVTKEDLEELAEEGEYEYEYEYVYEDEEAEETEADYDEVIGQIEEEVLYERELAEEADDDSRSYLENLERQVADNAMAALARGQDVSPAIVEAISGIAEAQAAAAEEVVVEDTLGPRAAKDVLELQKDPLEDLPNDTYIMAQKAVESYKLTRTELARLVPEDWDTETIDWFTNKRQEQIPLPEYQLTFLWTEANIGVAVDQVYSRGQKSPLTEFFFWPTRDAWEELKSSLEARPWISEKDKITLLNRLTMVINYWQDTEADPPHSLGTARLEFPDCSFAGN